MRNLLRNCIRLSGAQPVGVGLVLGRNEHQRARHGDLMHRMLDLLVALYTAAGKGQSVLHLPFAKSYQTACYLSHEGCTHTHSYIFIPMEACSLEEKP